MFCLGECEQTESLIFMDSAYTVYDTRNPPRLTLCKQGSREGCTSANRINTLEDALQKVVHLTLRDA
jgi:hypothetical protein